MGDPSVRLPPVDASTTWLTVHHRDPGFVALAEAELHALVGGASLEPGLWRSSRSVAWGRLAYGSAGGRELAEGATLPELVERVRALGLVIPRFHLSTRCLPRRHPGSTQAKALVADAIDGDPSIDAPQLRLLLVISARGLRLLVDEEPGPSDARWLDARHKPHNYLVGLPVRLGQAMLHLVARPGDTVLDPFCGSGTIPLLASLAGHRAFGSDVSAGCVERSAANLAHFGLEATFVRSDAREATQPADCIVTNPPYGAYSHLAEGALEGSLEHLATLAPRGCFVSSASLAPALERAGWRVEQVIPVEEERFARFVVVARVGR